MVSKASIDWYKVLYDLKDYKLIGYFWTWYYKHKVKSKRRAARFVLLHYYPVDKRPKKLAELLSLNRCIEVANFDVWSALENELL